MTLGWLAKNATDVFRAAREVRAGAARERWPRERLLAFQHERLAKLVAHASAASPFHRAHYGGILAPADVRLADLPPVTKTMMMERFDEFTTDRRLTRAAVEAHLTALGADDELFLGTYRIMASSGSSGRKGLYVYDRAAWAAFLTGAMRSIRYMGVAPRLPRRRLAFVAAPDAKHMTRRGTASLRIGPFRSLSLSAAQPIEELTRALDAFQPEVLNGYPSALAMLATEQLEGRLRIAPRAMATSSEVCTAEMRGRMQAAWNVEPFDMLGLTETGVTAIDCAAHRGLHLFEDHTIYEVVDERNRPVPPGTQGHKILVTNLDNYTQPFIRFEVTDLVTVIEAPCDCGRTFARITAIDGRSDDILELPRAAGGTTQIHPIHLRSALAARAEVAQYQISQTADGLDVTLALGRGADAADVASRIAALLGEKLAAEGAAAIPIRVHVVARIDREHGAGKLKLVKALPKGPRGAPPTPRLHP